MPGLGGRGEMQRTHKWTGIFTGVFAAVHWLIEMGDDVFESVFGRAGNLSEQNYAGTVSIAGIPCRLDGPAAMVAATTWHCDGHPANGRQLRQCAFSYWPN